MELITFGARPLAPVSAQAARWSTGSRVSMTPTAPHTRTSATLVEHNCLFVRNQYGEVASRLSERAREIGTEHEVVKAGATKDEAAEIKKQLEAAGATVEVK